MARGMESPKLFDAMGLSIGPPRRWAVWKADFAFRRRIPTIAVCELRFTEFSSLRHLPHWSSDEMRRVAAARRKSSLPRRRHRRCRPSRRVAARISPTPRPLHRASPKLRPRGANVVQSLQRIRRQDALSDHSRIGSRRVAASAPRSNLRRRVRSPSRSSTTTSPLRSRSPIRSFPILKRCVAWDLPTRLSARRSLLFRFSTECGGTNS